MAIARTLILKNCPILIFDDSLGAVDTETGAAIRQTISFLKPSTTLMISHRIATLAEADVILVLDGGRWCRPVLMPGIDPAGRVIPPHLDISE